MKTVSVIITTYNGSLYIIPQLESIRDQTLLPNEVLIFDDRSTDGTVYKINDFIKENELDWKLIINPKQYGWRYNFIQGFQKSSCQYLFPCDQDDIWEKNKIELMVNVMENNPQISLLVSNYSLKYEQSYHGKKKNPKFVNDSSIKKLPIKNLQSITRPGCTFCFRRDLFIRVFPFWKEGFAHDALLWRCAIAEGSAYIYNFSSIIFRRHGQNNSPKIERSRAQKINIYKDYIKIFSQIKKYSFYYNKATVSFSLELAKFYLYRFEFLERPDLKNLGQLLFSIKNYNSFKEILLDILLAYLKLEPKSHTSETSN